MLDSSSRTTGAEDALQMVRLLKNRSGYVPSGDAVVWEQVEKVLLAEDNFSESAPEAQLQSRTRFDTDRQTPCCCSHSNFVDGDSVVRYDDDRLQKALLFIHQHLDASIGVQDITREICVSRRWLEYAFRAAFGISPFQYLRCVRLELARLRLISEPQSKVHQIAVDSGFTSARQFTMTFRQYFGYCPSVCRARKDVVYSGAIGPLAEAC